MSIELKLKEGEILDLARFGLRSAMDIVTGRLTPGVPFSAASLREFQDLELGSMKLAPPPLGHYWEGQGGIRAVPNLTDEDGGDYDLVIVTGPDKKTPVFFSEREFGGYGTLVPDAMSKRDGLVNTKALLAAGNVLAKDISGVVSPDGHTDSYWAAQGELMGCYIYVPGYFGTDAYWSSTQDDAHGAWGQGFEYGNVYYWFKDGTGKAFPVRRVYR